MLLLLQARLPSAVRGTSGRTASLQARGTSHWAGRLPQATAAGLPTSQTSQEAARQAMRVVHDEAHHCDGWRMRQSSASWPWLAHPFPPYKAYTCWANAATSLLVGLPCGGLTCVAQSSSWQVQLLVTDAGFRCMQRGEHAQQCSLTLRRRAAHPTQLVPCLVPQERATYTPSGWMDVSLTQATTSRTLCQPLGKPEAKHC